MGLLFFIFVRQFWNPSTFVSADEQDAPAWRQLQLFVLVFTIAIMPFDFPALGNCQGRCLFLVRTIDGDNRHVA